MAIKYGFFNSVNSDRTYDADDFNYLIKRLVSNGVFSNPATSLQVVESSGMTVNVLAGFALIDSHYFESTSSVPLTIEPADLTFARIDRVVLHLSRTDRTISFRVLKGTPATDPVAPSMTNNADVSQLSLAEILIPKQSTSVATKNITDTRYDSNVCGIVASLVTQLDTSEIYRQYTSQAEHDRDANQTTFNNFMTTLNNDFSGDTAGKLGNRITALESKPVIYKGTSSTPPSEWKDGDIYVQYE